MNRAVKASLINSEANPFYLRPAFFHSTPMLDRRRRNQWDTRFNSYAKKCRRIHAKQTLLRNVSAFADHLFQSWRHDHDDYGPSSSRGNSWFRGEYRAKGSRGAWSGNRRSQYRGRRSFQFCEDDVEVETIFRSAFGGNGYFYWSFVNEEFPQGRNSSTYSNNYRTRWNWTHQDEEEDDSSTESDSSETDLVSNRVALGLSAYGPLKLEDVKNAYRECALKWHPDRHNGSSKVAAEEKFKVCSAAYQSLCDKLAVN